MDDGSGHLSISGRNVRAERVEEGIWAARLGHVL